METNHEVRFRRSVWKDAIVERLRQLAVGEEISYAALSEAVGVDVASDRYAPVLRSARRAMERDGVLIVPWRKGGGVVRANAEAGKDAVDSDMRSIRRKTKRTITRARAVDISALPNKARSEHLTTVGVLGTLELATNIAARRRAEKEIRASDSEQPKELDVRRMLELLKG